jgi:hypothetical protein
LSLYIFFCHIIYFRFFGFSLFFCGATAEHLTALLPVGRDLEGKRHFAPSLIGRAGVGLFYREGGRRVFL